MRSVEVLWGLGSAAALAAGVYLSSCGPSGDPKSAATAAPKAATVAPSGSSETEAKAEPRGPEGWHAVYASAGAEAVRGSSAWAAFWLGEGQTIHPAVGADGLTASFAGDVTIEEAGRYRFAAQMQGGMAKLSVMKGSRSLGQAALSPDQTSVETAWMELPAGVVSVNVNFTRNGSGAARLRTVWEKAGVGQGMFKEEPISPGYVTVARQGITDAESAQRALHGRVLVGELNCVACHGGGSAADAVSVRTAPYLGEIGRRASPEWLLKWIKDPLSMRPGTVMPKVFDSTEQDGAAAEAVVHYLLSLGSVPEWQSAARETQVVEEGARLYHSVGCVACHGVLDDPSKVFKEALANPGEKRELAEPPAPFGKLSGKWRPAGLAEFLVDPVRTHPSGRMPGMALTKPEVDFIATYLVNSWDPDPQANKPAAFVPDPEKVNAGKAVFAAKGCASCHQTGHSLPDVAPTLKAKPLAELKRGEGCLDPADTKTPRYSITDKDRVDLVAGLTELRRVNSPAPAPIDMAHRLVEALNCRACHEINETGGVAEGIRTCFRTVDDAELGNEGRFPPRLTGVGLKLTTRWMKKVMTEAGRTRPYMMTRMPQFGAKVVGDLPAALAQMEGVAPESDVAGPTVSDGVVVAGRTLVGEKGMNCISCHVYGGKLAGTPGPEITGFAEQLRYEWWKPYLMNPQRFKPLTRMTAFYHYPDGKGQVKDVYGGDFDRQSEAMWAYFVTSGGSAEPGSGGAPAPEGLPSAKGLPLIVGAKPVVFRTFLKDGGSRGIAVGYPIGVHFGFDATGVRLVNAWKGEFIDATSSWKGRGGMTATGQGKTIWKAPAGPSLVIGGRPEAWPQRTGEGTGYRFEGYRINDKGVPVFLYRVGEAKVEEMFEPAEQGQIRRTFTVSGVPAGASVWLAVGHGLVSSSVISNVAEDKAQAVGEVKVEAYTPKEAGQAMSFAVLIKPEVK